jgi:hypothetical protein
MRAAGSVIANSAYCCGEEGEHSGINLVYRPYREEGLGVRKRQTRNRAVGTRAPSLVEAWHNARWALILGPDQFACGSSFRVLNIVNDVTRQCLAAIPDTSISRRQAPRKLTDMTASCVKPNMTVSENGNEFTAKAIPA